MSSLQLLYKLYIFTKFSIVFTVFVVGVVFFFFKEARIRQKLPYQCPPLRLAVLRQTKINLTVLYMLRNLGKWSDLTKITWTTGQPLHRTHGFGEQCPREVAGCSSVDGPKSPHEINQPQPQTH